MKKYCLLLLCILFLCSLNVFADCLCESETEAMAQAPCNKPCVEREQSPCPQTYSQDVCDGFLCRNISLDVIAQEIGLSETQFCTAMKIQDKYEQEVLSLNERIQSEEENLATLKEDCSRNRELRKEKSTIKNLIKARKKICDCYEKQFLSILSDPQKRAYKKIK